jgi:hypothetical protein
MLGIESDVNATRKIVRGGIITRGDAIQALAPILPLAIGPHGQGEASADSVLREKLGPDERLLFELMSTPSFDEQQIITWLTESRQ